jgi:DNA primase
MPGRCGKLLPDGALKRQLLAEIAPRKAAGAPAPQRQYEPGGYEANGAGGGDDHYPDMPPPQDFEPTRYESDSKPKFQQRKFVKGKRWGGKFEEPIEPPARARRAAEPAGRGGAAAGVEHGAVGGAVARAARDAVRAARPRTARSSPGWTASCTSTACSPGRRCAKACAGMDFEALAERLMAVAESGPVPEGEEAQHLAEAARELASVLDFMLDDLPESRSKAKPSRPSGKDPKALERYKALETRRLELRARIRASGAETA